MRNRYVMGGMGMLLSGLASASAQQDVYAEIKTVIYAYGKAMNASNVEGVVNLFDENGVFMPSGLPTATGAQAIRAAYRHEFEVIDLDVHIVIDEVQNEGDLAYVRSRSLGQLTMLANGEKRSTENYRAFFVLKKRHNTWKISRFMFNFAK